MPLPVFRAALQFGLMLERDFRIEGKSPHGLVAIVLCLAIRHHFTFDGLLPSSTTVQIRIDRIKADVQMILQACVV